MDLETKLRMKWQEEEKEKPIRNDRIWVRVSSDDKEKIRNDAERNGMSMSHYLLHCALLNHKE